MACIVLFNRQITILTKESQSQIQSLTTNFQKQIESLTDNILKVSVETSRAISDLAAAVKQLEIKSNEANYPK